MNSGVLGGLNRPGLCRFLALVALFAFSVGASAQTYQINSLGDQPLGTAGSISCVSTVGTCTLRAAIQANNNRTTTSATVNFANIPISPDEDGLSSVIRPGSALPAITNRITIAGETHPNFDASNGYPRVRLNGEDLTTNNSGLFISGSGASGTIIRSLAVYDFRNYGISVNNADEAQILGNRLGTYILQFGTTALEIPNFGNDNFGLSLAGSSASQVLNNRVASNGSGGIRLATGTANTLVAGNGIGFGQATGSPFRVPNVGPGIFIASSAGPGNEIGRCMIISGISNFCSGNTIVANASHGIQVAAPDQRIVFNAMGVHPDAPTNVGFGNDGDGIRIQASLVFVGNGIAPGDSFTGNVIGHNGGDGVRVISGSDAQISRNRIGGNPAGDEFGNSGAGVRILAGGDHVVANNFIRRNDDGIVSSAGPTLILGNDLIGNTDIGIEVTDWRHTIENNFIGSHQLFGLILDYPNSQVEFATVYGNWVGTAPDGTWLGNSNGILVARGRALIGNDQGRGNVIAGNNNEGIILLDTSEVWVRSNFIGELPDGTPRGNGGTGILLQQGPGAQGTNLSLIGYSQANTIPPAHVQTAAGGNGRGNIIAHNALGVRIMGGSADLTRNRFRGNRIHGNQNGGIQIFSQIGGINEGAGEGPNRLLNHPQLDDNATFFDSGSGTIEYRVLVPTLASQADYPLRLDFYITNPGESQGRFFLGTVSYPAASANNWLSGSLTPVGGYDLNDAMIVAMATDAQGNSSEFSANPADLSIGSPSPFDNIIISSFGDAPNADLSSTSCDTGNPFIAPGVPNCTLRAAIQAANNHTDPVTITFWEGLAAPGGVSTFSPSTQLPAISAAVTLAGESHASFDAANGPSVVISGQFQSTNNALFRVSNASNVELRHVALADSPREGLVISGSSNVLVRDSLVGLRPDSGAFVAGINSTNGINVSNSSAVNLIDNWIAASVQRGVQISNGASAVDLLGNIIGAGRDSNGNLVPLGNSTGVTVLGTAGSDIRIGRCTGLPPNEVCSGNRVVAGVTGLSIAGSGVSMASNWIGVNPDAPAAEGFGNSINGVNLSGAGHLMTGGLVIGQGANVIGHSGSHGLLVNGNGHQISGVFVGVTPAGAAVGNAENGILVESGADHLISSSRIANNTRGLRFESGGNTLSNSRVLDNALHGVVIEAGPQQILNNVIGGNGQFGLLYGHPSPGGEVVNLYGNRVGVDLDGSPIPNSTGIHASNAGLARIGNDDENGNVVAFNTVAGIFLDRASGNEVKGNWIGVLPDGTPAGNQGPGIAITSLAPNASGGNVLVGFNTNDGIPVDPVGGGVGALGNVIAHNDYGVLINTAQTNVNLNQVRVRGNRIYDNAEAGIQLGPEAGFIDPGGAMEGPNRLLNHPQFDPAATFIDSDNGNLVYRLQVPTAVANASYPLRVDFYLNESSEAQGRYYIGSTVYTSDVAESWLSGSLVPVGGYDLNGAWMVAMATDADGNSSEFTAAPVQLQSGVDPIEGIVISALGDAPNADPNSDVCDTGNPFIAPGVPNCTLRAAIQAANNHSDPVTITFWEGLPAPGGVSTFAPGTQLPAIGGEVTLAGETHASFNAANGPSVRISGAQQSTGHGLIVSGNNSVIRHVAITGFPQDGLRIQSSGSVLVHDSLIGLAPGSGAFVADGNGRHGVVLTGASGNELRDNWISANTQRGVQIDSGSAGNALVGNRIGAGRDGSGNLVPAGNGNVGVITMGTAGFNNQIGRCEVNLPDPNPVCSGNLIVANGSAGISITGGSQVLASNWVGVNPIAPQDEGFGNGGAAGIVLASNGNELQGGLQSGLGSNVIGHSAADGILITADGNQLANVLVGVTPAGDDVGNASQGIRVESGRDNQISSSRIANNVNGVVLMDGPNSVSDNRIVDNQNNGVMVIEGGQWIDDNRIGGHGLTGIFFGHSVDASADGLLRITANRIGVDTDGESMPNQVGIWGLMAGRANIGEVDGLGNVIASNQNAGVVLDTTSNARIVNNHIGVLPDGTAAGNGGAGVSITTSSGGGISLQNVVGYPATLSLPAEPVGGGPDARGNVIANHLVGVIINSNETDPVLLRNSLRGNRFLNNNIGVQLGESAGGTDPGGGQQGPNRLQNPPEFDAMATFFDESSGQVEFSFRVDTLASNASFPIRVDFYLAAGSQGDVYLHTETYGSGDATQFVSGSFTPPAGLDLVGASLVGMATDDGGNSSEFSAPVSLGELTDELFSDRFE